MPLAAARRLVLVALIGAVAFAGCGGSEAQPPPAAPGANVDPNADGVVGGSINKAKGVAEDSEERDAQLEQP